MSGCRAGALGSGTLCGAAVLPTLRPCSGAEVLGAVRAGMGGAVAAVPEPCSGAVRGGMGGAVSAGGSAGGGRGGELCAAAAPAANGPPVQSSLGFS